MTIGRDNSATHIRDTSNSPPSNSKNPSAQESTSNNQSRRTELPTHSFPSKVLIVLAYLGFFCIAVPGIIFLTGKQIDSVTGFDVARAPTVFWISVGLTLLGGGFVLVSMIQLWIQGKGLPVSHLPPRNLVTSGAYRLCRHPIYIGFTLAYLGIALQHISPSAAIFSSLLLTAAWVAYALLLEEPMLHQRIGAEYHEYCRLVPLLPLFPESLLASTVKSFFARVSGSLEGFANKPVLFRIGNVVYVTYGLLCGLAAFVQAFWIEGVLLGSNQLPPHVVYNFVILVSVATPVGAWLFWWLGHARELLKARWFGIGRIGFVSYGGLVGMALSVATVASVEEVSPWILSDALMPALFLLYAIGRIGCVSFGCCYGRQAEGEWGFKYVHPEAKMIRLGDSREIFRHPVQLYGVLHGLAGFALLALLILFTPPTGLVTVCGTFLVGYGRMFSEHFRERPRNIFGRYTAGQVGGLVTLLLGWSGLFVLEPDNLADAVQLPDVGSVVEHPESVIVALCCAGIVAFVYGFNWKEIGTWTGH